MNEERRDERTLLTDDELREAARCGRRVYCEHVEAIGPCVSVGRVIGLDGERLTLEVARRLSVIIRTRIVALEVVNTEARP
jgi:hypothetical protein